MANNGANTKDLSDQSRKAASIQQGPLLPPLIISFNETLKLTNEAARIRQHKRIRDTHASADTAPPVPTATEQDAVEELPRARGSHQDEDKALEMPRKVVVEAEKASGVGQDRPLFQRRRQWPQLSFRKIFKKVELLKDVGLWPNKRIYVVSIILLSAAMFGGITVVGLLQSTERVGTSGIIIQPPPPPPPSTPKPPPPEPTVEIDVFGDSGCTTAISEIEWGLVEAGSSVSETVYIKNSGDQSITLSLSTENWNPASVANYMVLSWDYDGSPLESGASVGVTLMLTVDSSITGIENFSFGIVIIGLAS